MMFRHLIVLSSSYKLGKRIVFHVAGTKDEDFDVLNSIFNLEVFKFCSVYSVETDSDTWDSVVEYDAFYEDIYVCSTREEFEKLIKENGDISVFDLAKYIVVKLRDMGLYCSHLKLQKLVYFCYEKYLLTYKKRLFNEKIYAWKFGPVVRDLYYKFKSEEIKVKVDLDIFTVRQRIIFSEDAFDKLVTIDEVLESYGMLSAENLVDLSHKEGTPWSYWDGKTRNFEITDELILKCA